MDAVQVMVLEFIILRDYDGICYAKGEVNVKDEARSALMV